jgi:integrase
MSKINFTKPRVDGFTCPEGREQAFLWDSTAPGLGLRVTPAGKPSFIFQSTLHGKSLRITIGGPQAWSIPEAQAKARELQRQLDEGIDPRVVRRERLEQQAVEALEAKASAITVGQAWERYAVEGRPKRRDGWKPRYVADMAKMVAPGGQAKKRGSGLTLPGHLHPVMQLALVDVTEDALAAWFEMERRRSKHQAARAWMMFRGFLRWCSVQPDYRDLVDREVGRAPAIIENLPATKRRTDALESDQVKGWWAEATKLPNPVASAYLRALLLTGARREEMAALRWDAVDLQWKKLTIADKVGETRTIPCSSYMVTLLSNLPRSGEFVFSSASKSGRITDPRSAHERVLEGAGIDGLTIHGLRRSFSLLGEAAGAPAGAIAQIMGHRPSATAEGYRPRSIDALRPYLQKIEEHILGLAATCGAVAQAPALTLVASAA